jgi:hypothetical protein
VSSLPDYSDIGFVDARRQEAIDAERHRSCAICRSRNQLGIIIYDEGSSHGPFLLGSPSVTDASLPKTSAAVSALSLQRGLPELPRNGARPLSSESTHIVLVMPVCAAAVREMPPQTYSNSARGGGAADFRGLEE